MADLTDTSHLPPQATGNTLPGMAADLADIAPAPSAEEALRAVNYGDKGAQQYAALQAAGQQAPATSATPPAPAPGAGAGPLMQLAGGAPPATGSYPGANALDPLGAALMTLGGGDFSKVQNARLQQQKAAQQFRAQQVQTTMRGLDFMNSLRTNNVAPEVRVALIQEFAAANGQPALPPAQAAYIASLSNDPNLMSHLLERVKAGDIEATTRFNELFSGDPVKMLTAADAIRKADADADRAIADATKAQNELKKGDLGGARNIREMRFQQQAIEELGPNATPGAIAKRAEDIRTRTEAGLAESKKVVGLVAEGRLQAARALKNLGTLEDLGKRLLTDDPTQSYVQPFEFLFRRAMKDPQLAELSAVPGTLSNLARGLGEKGVLTDTDLRRVQAAVQPSSTDTWSTYSARLKFVRSMISEGQAALEDAARTGRIAAVDSSRLGTFDGDPYPPSRGAAAAPAGGVSRAPARGRISAADFLAQ